MKRREFLNLNDIHSRLKRMSRALPVLVVGCCIWLVAGCGGDCQMYEGYEVPVVFRGFESYAGKTFKVRVIQDRSESERKVFEIPAGPFDFRTFVFCQQNPTQFDFYVDLDSNGVYSPPPADHAWRREVKVRNDDALVFSPDTNYVDIQFPD